MDAQIGDFTWKRDFWEIGDPLKNHPFSAKSAIKKMKKITRSSNFCEIGEPQKNRTVPAKSTSIVFCEIAETQIGERKLQLLFL